MFAFPLIWTVPLLAASAAGPSAALVDDYNACGPVCLYAVARLKDRDVDFDRVKELVGPAEGGAHGLDDVADAGRRLGLFPVAATATRSGLSRLRLPAIAHLKHSLFGRGGDQPHFVVLLATEERGVMILDPPFRTAAVRWDGFEEAWTGNLLLFAETAEEAQQWRAGLDSAVAHQLTRWLLPSGGFLLFALLITIQWGSCRALFRKLVRTATRFVGSPGKAGASATAAGVEEWTRGRSARRIALCVLLILMAGVTPVVVGSWIGGSAILETPGDTLDLGEFAAPGETKASISIRNTGTRPLIIERIATSCGCAVAEIPPPIKPGGKSDLGLSLGVSPGSRSADIVFYSNDPQGPHRLVLQWHGVGKPLLFPPRILASDVPLGSTYERTVHIVYPGGKSAMVPEVVTSECDIPGFELRVGRNDPYAFRAARSGLSRLTTVGYLDLDLRVESPEKAKVIDSSCEITLRHGKTEHVLILPLRISFVGEVCVEHRRILFSENHASALVGKERRVKITIDAGEGTGVVRVKEAPDWLACDLVRTSATEYDLSVRVRGVPGNLCATGKILLQAGSHELTDTSVDVLAIALQE